MSAPRTLKLTSTGDLDVSTGGLAVTSTLAEFVAIRVKQRLQFFLGEWYLDTRQGLPYFAHVFVSNPDLALISSIFRRAVLGTPGVGSLDVFEVAYARSTRRLAVNLRVRCTDGTVANIETPFIIALPGSS